MPSKMTVVMAPRIVPGYVIFFFCFFPCFFWLLLWKEKKRKKTEMDSPAKKRTKRDDKEEDDDSDKPKEVSGAAIVAAARELAHAEIAKDFSLKEANDIDDAYRRLQDARTRGRIAFSSEISTAQDLDEAMVYVIAILCISGYPGMKQGFRFIAMYTKKEYAEKSIPSPMPTATFSNGISMKAFPQVLCVPLHELTQDFIYEAPIDCAIQWSMGRECCQYGYKNTAGDIIMKSVYFPGTD
jgi:hypothetical protein